MRKTTQPPQSKQVDPVMNAWLIQLVQNVNGIIVPAPASASAYGNPFTFAIDTNYIYACIAPNTWKRIPIASW